MVIMNKMARRAKPVDRRVPGEDAREPSLVDMTEQALRGWIGPGHYRPGDRLPPEHDLAGMLGVSRGTLRLALERLEHSGEIVRRQGSGTFVGNVDEGASFSAGLEVLEPYSLMATRHGAKVTMRDLRVAREPVADDVAAELGLEPNAEAVVVERVLVTGGEPGAYMLDVIHPSAPLPPADELAGELDEGAMVLDLLLTALPIAFGRTHIYADLVARGDRAGDALGVAKPTAVLKTIETVHLASGDAVQHSTNLFLPGRIALHVMRGRPRPEPGDVPRP